MDPEGKLMGAMHADCQPPSALFVYLDQATSAMAKGSAHS